VRGASRTRRGADAEAATIGGIHGARIAPAGGMTGWAGRAHAG
jgi:hypothetical protein